ncbi:MAG: SCP2 sterol-binding domain-containing protein [Chloroflexi bacterium]|uniref:SCP2 sterol-binding domain-containing protein n=1 Tax=Candidatus Chlorohelix allophototropha TaxID=3003348 RepID=A0A8T7M9C7_9CHLR|nr:SCP2 sterol-binding domain-containing protein [Chloroflexota bacterium]WJW68483.1 SCP2 sterol-binding domain-containing protein [Chloroflexota bacterium L227-S17]
MALFGTQEWLDEFREALNTSASYEDAAKEWEGDFYFIASPDETSTDEITMYLNLQYGKCLEAIKVEDASLRTPEFTVKGPADSWFKVATNELDPMQAIMTGKLSLKGNMQKVMKNLKAANELVNSLKLVPTELPG